MVLLWFSQDLERQGCNYNGDGQIFKDDSLSPMPQTDDVSHTTEIYFKEIIRLYGVPKPLYLIGTPSFCPTFGGDYGSDQALNSCLAQPSIPKLMAK